MTTVAATGEDDLTDRRVQIKSRERIRDLAEVYTHQREVAAMLDFVGDLFPSERDPLNTDRTFFEPACGSGNFLEEILRRKLRFVTARRLGRGQPHEHRILRCLASIYGIDISRDNVLESRDRLRSLITSHLDNDLNTQSVSPGFVTAVEVILASNLIHGDTLADAARIELIDYRPGPGCTFTREWSFLDRAVNADDLFSTLIPRKDELAVHYSLLVDYPAPRLTASAHGISE